MRLNTAIAAYGLRVCLGGFTAAHRAKTGQADAHKRAREEGSGMAAEESSLIVSPHPPVIPPMSPPRSSTAYKLQVPLGFVPLKIHLMAFASIFSDGIIRNTT